MSSPSSHQPTPQPQLSMQTAQSAAISAPPDVSTARTQPTAQIHHPQTPMQSYYYGPPPPGLPYPPHYGMPPIPPPNYNTGSAAHNGVPTPAPSNPGVQTIQRRDPCRRQPKPNYELPSDFGNFSLAETPSLESPAHFPETVELAAEAKKTADEKKQKQKTKNDKDAKRGQSKKDTEHDSDDAPTKRSRGGRTKGASTYSTQELCALVKFVGEILPIGQKGWSSIEEKYNQWARKGGFPERKKEALRGKFENIVAQAKVKPTGEGERRQMYFDALGVEEEINNKLSMTAIQDADETGSSSAKSENSDDEVEVISSSMKKKKGTVLTKSYKIEAPLPDPSKRVASRRNQAHSLLEKIGSAIDPTTQKQRDDDRASSNFQLVMIQGLQAQVNTLTNQANEERRRADRAESELRMLQMLYGRGSRSSRYSRRDSYSPSPQQRRWSHSPTPSPKKRYYQRRRNRSISDRRSPSPPYQWPHSPPSPPYRSRRRSPPPSGNQPYPLVRSTPVVHLSNSTFGDDLQTSIASSSSVPLEALAQLASQIPPVEPGTGFMSLSE
ncbi:hypothetical protein F5880DRAFT_1618617 [Lentinula raphanica]|nr:hypothetical protein F5880DRAFT_1618617 [Lentinula raphanica]